MLLSKQFRSVATLATDPGDLALAFGGAVMFDEVTFVCGVVIGEYFLGTLTSSFWPASQWPGKLQMKK